VLCFPAAYGAPGEADALLPWSYVEQRVRAASNYWIKTVGPNARPHARPVDGVWVDGALCFGGSPEARWVRNFMANPSISVHLSSEAEAIILEGAAEHVTPRCACRARRGFVDGGRFPLLTVPAAADTIPPPIASSASALRYGSYTMLHSAVSCVLAACIGAFGT
jgi:hypothetical protein